MGRKPNKTAIGGLVGSSNGGRIENCHAEGTITVNGDTKDANVGGLIGDSNNTQISNSSSKVKIKFSRITTYRKISVFVKDHKALTILGLIISAAAIVIPILVNSQPARPPDLSSLASSSPIFNIPGSANIQVIATPDFIPPYRNDIMVKIYNPNSRKCYMVIEMETSEGFHFLPVNNLPDNFILEQGYEYQSKMKVYINGFPPEYTYALNLQVYTLNQSLGGNESIKYKVLQSQFED